MTKSILSSLILVLCSTHVLGNAFYRGEITMQKAYKASIYQISWGASPVKGGDDQIQYQVALDKE